MRLKFQLKEIQKWVCFRKSYTIKLDNTELIYFLGYPVTLTGMIFLKSSCDVIRARVWSIVSPICVQNCECQGVCLTTHIQCGCNACSSQRGRIWVYWTYMHEYLYGVVWVAQRLVLVCSDVQDPHATYQWYEEFSMGWNPTVCNSWSFF